MVVLPISGDLWIPPTMDESGNIVPRTDTVSAADLPQRAKMTPDQAAILMAELDLQKSQRQS